MSGLEGLDNSTVKQRRMLFEQGSKSSSSLGNNRSTSEESLDGFTDQPQLHTPLSASLSWGERPKRVQLYEDLSKNNRSLGKPHKYSSLVTPATVSGGTPMVSYYFLQQMKELQDQLEEANFQKQAMENELRQVKERGLLPSSSSSTTLSPLQEGSGAITPASERAMDSIQFQDFKKDLDRVNINLIRQLEQLTVKQSMTVDPIEENLSLQQRVTELGTRFEQYVEDKQLLEAELKRERLKNAELLKYMELHKTSQETLQRALDATKQKLKSKKNKLKSVISETKTEQLQMIQELKELKEQKAEIEKQFEQVKLEVKDFLVSSPKVSTLSVQEEEISHKSPRLPKKATNRVGVRL